MLNKILHVKLENMHNLRPNMNIHKLQNKYWTTIKHGQWRQKQNWFITPQAQGQAMHPLEAEIGGSMLGTVHIHNFPLVKIEDKYWIWSFY